MQKLQIYCGGEFLKTKTVHQVTNPYDNTVVGQTYLGGITELEKAVNKTQSVEMEMKNLPSHHKYEALMQIANTLKSEREEAAKILCLESAKPIKYALDEIDRAIQTFVVAAEEAKRLPKEYIDLDWTPAGVKKEGLVKYFPVGLVAGISPFNFPLNLAVHKIAPAIAAGCPIILKPSSSTPLSTLNLARIIDQTKLPKGAVSIIPMDRQTGNQLVTDERFKLLSFTGSPVVGWQMKKDAGKKKVVLELGGNAGVIVTNTADINEAVQKCVVGGFAYSGQVCIHAQRMYVHHDTFDEFASKFIEKVKKLNVGDPIDPETDISSMIDETNAIRVENWVQEAVDEGAEILTGGKRKGSYFPPTVLTKTLNNMKVCALEVFGPVVTLESFTHFEDALTKVNEGNYGLQAGVFTNQLSEINKAFDLLEVGGVIINDIPTFRVDHMPYGGIKDSGLGREGVKYAIHDMMEARILVKNR
ncbi:MAG: aldehyde dehydrogenase family protein [Bacteroidales bacterium]|nr:aldehyde dehydrogenase family protein [Bacteroidales bacterium]